MSEHAAMNAALRRAAGRSVAPEPQALIEHREKQGDIGIGRGGAARPVDRRKLGNAAINERIRAAARLATNRIDLDGVSLDDISLDDARRR